MEVLLITTRNIYESTGEYKLIKRRADELFKGFNIKTKVISFQRQSRINSTKFEDTKDFQYLIKTGFKKSTFIFDLIRFRKQLKKYLNTNKPKKIIVSGFFAFFFNDIIINYKMKNNCDVYLDMHGCDEELTEYGSVLKKRVFNILVKFVNKSTEKLVPHCKGFLAVSSTLVQYIIDKYKVKPEEKDFFLIPCGNYGVIKDYKERLYHRNIWRKKLGITDDEIVFVYSGGISKWQMVDETIKFLLDALKINKNFKICIFSGQIEEFKKRIDKLGEPNKIILKSLESTEVPLALTACDIGIILRENNLTNEVAFPTKFADYLEGGLHIILSSVKSQVEIIQKYNLGIGSDHINKLSPINIDNELNNIMNCRLNNIELYYKTCDSVINDLLDYSKNIQGFGMELLDLETKK
ncbi:MULTISPECIES: glycosyltransferase [Bacillus cereus group]|uniref:glycosyltransferase n=1 Tax=Bacillus cereus group TaxID=86661 RepID=UPI000BEC09EF|nr:MULTISPECIES: glycosyltransferase [Bacillus cereus group]MBJ7930954.1 hypothetical protein [Bacillus cereus group sp. N31]PEG13585.1 hypothetical protein COO04_24835 [Bacillus toyonensis]PEK07624.1 hypothetical protein CN681_21280 [Bacillus toyonensis]PGA57584.1 hypothetical protein COL86_07615 [Bacillus toyonensis]PGC04536.1 hypothetical protein COM19_03130 [Bacillus toyonensis]